MRGATTEWSCEELFHELLALDHQREQPYASFHGINVACYLLQHPSGAEPRYQGAQLKTVTVFCDAGDVAVDGTFPANGYAERVEQWAHAVRAA
jgi:hypothetical protein